MDDENEKELEQRRLTDKVREEVEHELKRRYSWIGLIVAVIMGSVVTLTVREILYPARVQMEVMKELQQQATNQLANTASQSEKLTKQFADLEQASEMLRQKLTEASKINLSFTDDIRIKLADLSGIVSELNKAVVEIISEESGRESQNKLQRRIGIIDDSLKRSGDNIQKAMKKIEYAG